ncbi:ABC transporter substrate-binding protein [Ornithinimicrobium faecis]|uniref:taurine ABC transporter substrate-binding protein n=1 Tax=Ornithinimicrobium faecis TaxID=2934158 RepID=UPI0021176147|nr:ABC transporter substrate-binding protein [Ornithinimicrobium sp. HY1745]
MITTRSRATRARSARGVALAAAVGILLAGCVDEGRSSNPDDEEASGGSGASSDCPIEVNEDIDTTVAVGYQPIPNGDLVVRDLGWLEACMPNATVSWVKVASGGEMVQAFGSGSVDLGLVGSSPATKAVSPPNNIDMQVIWIHDVIGEAESLVVQEGAGDTLADLAGKSVAVPFASTAHYSLLAALEREGMTPADIELINLSPDAMLAAWERQEIDAAWVWAPTLPLLTESGHIIVSAADTAEAGAPTFDLAGATTEFVDANPEFMEVWTALQDQAVQMILEDEDAAAESIGVQLGISTDEVLDQLGGYTFLTAADQAGEDYFGGQLSQDLINTADFLVTQEEIDEVNTAEAYEAAIYTDAIDKVAGQ